MVPRIIKLLIILLLALLLISVIALIIYLAHINSLDTNYIIGAPKINITQQISFCWEEFINTKVKVWLVKSPSCVLITLIFQRHLSELTDLQMNQDLLHAIFSGPKFLRILFRNAKMCLLLAIQESLAK